MNEYWYDWPMQVKYLRGSVYSEGIVYQNFIIDLIDGAPSTIKDVLYWAKTQNVSEDDAIIEWCDWKNLGKI